MGGGYSGPSSSLGSVHTIYVESLGSIPAQVICPKSVPCLSCLSTVPSYKGKKKKKNGLKVNPD